MTHLGHMPSNESLKLNQVATNYIVQLLKDGFDAEQIVTKIRSQIACGSPRTRLLYTTTKDIRNIAKKHGIVPGRLHSNDIISVEARVDRKLPEDGIRYYEPRKPKTGDGFVMVERFHKRLKYEYRGRVANSRIDSIVNCLITAPEVIAHDFEIRMCRRLLYGRHRLTEQHKAHEAGIKALKEASIEVTDEGWKVRCKGTFFIKQKLCDCDPGLNNHCTRCDACPYAFYCTCFADSRAGVCCLHIHAAITSNPEGRHFVLPFKDDDNIRDACEDNNNNVIDVLSGDDSIYSDKENRQESETDRMDRNKENLQRIETCWSRIKAYSFEIAKRSEGADMLDHIAYGMQKICLDIAAREERCAPLIRRSELRALIICCPIEVRYFREEVRNYDDFAGSSSSS
ncbi:unnamed protein product [Heligmosomoides polygyrus]|uniref:SWIM-type domain-containing protein n=1 Tax=Heligmosomoides polygyrus TaxID=6339 RepID=A0A183FP16_HELPZ|nr:unnamed protein product [Heligmosomoides polygyrus]